MKYLLILATILLGLSLTQQFAMDNNNQTRRELEAADKVKERACKDMEKILYDIDSDQKTYGKEFRTTIRKSFRAENRLEIMITDPDSLDAGEEGMELLPIVGAYAVFAVLSLLGFFLYCCCTCCPDSICPPCKCCADKESGKCIGIQCDQKEEFKGIQLLVPLIFMFVSFLYIAICAIIGLANTSGIEDGFQSMHCAIIDTLYALNYGVENKEGKSWMGIVGFSNKLGYLANEIGGTYKDSVAATFGQNIDWIDDDKTAMNSQLEVMKVNYGSILTLNSDKYQYATDPKDGAQNINSCFFNEFEICSSDATDSNQQEIKWAVVVEALSQIITETVDANNEAAKNVKDQGDVIQEEIDSGMVKTIEDGQVEIDDIKKQLDDQISDMDKSLGDIGDIIKDLVTPNLQITFSVFLAISIILGIVGALIAVMKIYKLRFVLHLCWAFFSFLALFLFIFTAVFLVVSVAGSELCDFMDRALNDIDTFNDIDSLGDDLKEKLSICKNELYVEGSEFAKGDILGTFGVRDSLDEINKLDEQMASFDQTQEETNQGFTDIAEQLATSLDYLQALLDEAQVGGALEVSTLLAGLTAANDVVGACGGSVADILMLKQDDSCSFSPLVEDWKYWTDAGAQKDLQSGSGDIKQDSQSCVWINGDYTDTDDNTIAAPGGVTQAQLNARYGGCGFVSELQNLMNWVEDKNEVGLLKKEQTQDFLELFDTYKANNAAYLAKIGTFRDSTNDLTAGITADDGILGDEVTDCLFIGQKLDLINDAMCVVFFPNIYTFTKILAAFSFGLFFSSLFMCIMGSRFAKNARLGAKSKLAKVDNDYDKVQGGVAMEV